MLFERTIRQALTPPPAKPDPLAEARRRHEPTKHIFAARAKAMNDRLRAEVEKGHAA